MEAIVSIDKQISTIRKWLNAKSVLQLTHQPRTRRWVQPPMRPPPSPPSLPRGNPPPEAYDVFAPLSTRGALASACWRSALVELVAAAAAAAAAAAGDRELDIGAGVSFGNKLGIGRLHIWTLRGLIAKCSRPRRAVNCKIYRGTTGSSLTARFHFNGPYFYPSSDR